MSYRILVSLDTSSISGWSSDYVIRGGDMGDVMRAKDALIAQGKHREPGLTPTPRVAQEFLEANPPERLEGCVVELRHWDSSEDRAEWIKVWADREYVLDMGTGEVTSPQWSQDMDTYRPQIEALKAKR